MSPTASRLARGLALLLALQLILAGAAGAARRKRFVAFRQGSTFFYRLNYKVTTFPYTTIFSHASGFKVGWQLPTSKTQQQARALSASDLRDSAELVLESHGFNGKMCLLKSLCQVMEQIQGKDGALIKILNLLLGSGSSGNGTSASPGLDPLVCGNYANHCPLHLIGFNAFTERMKSLYILACVLLARLLAGEPQPGPLLTRRKRYLIFPQGSNVQLVYCLTIGAYAPRDGDLVLGLTAALAWELPSKAEPRLTGLLHRRSRAVAYSKIEAFLQATGLDGRSCVMRALCEAGQRSASEIGSGTFLQELLHAVFTIRNDGTTFEDEENAQYDYAHKSNGNCAELYPTCKHSIYSLNF